MNLCYKTYRISYNYIFNNSKDTVLFLHGWGGNMNSFAFLFPYLKQYNILTISFPPYFTDKNYQDSIIPLTLEDYQKIIVNLLTLHNIKSFHIICHSFGFRLALLITSCNYKIKSIIVTGGAGISLNNFIFNINRNSKILYNKKFKLINHKSDYAQLKKIDKLTFQNVIKVNLIKYLHFIKCPVYLFWGRKDKDTKPAICNMIKKQLKKVEFDFVNSGHFAYLDFRNMFSKKVLKFLKENV